MGIPTAFRADCRQKAGRDKTPSSCITKLTKFSDIIRTNFFYTYSWKVFPAIDSDEISETDSEDMNDKQTREAATLTLRFTGDNRVELTDTEFTLSPGCQPRITWRGKQHHNTGIGSFQWGTGTQALCLILLKYVAATQAIPPSHFCLASKNSDKEGHVHPPTPVTTLDNLLGKQVHWLKDMFGCYSDHSLIATRLFFRSNSGGKMRSREIQLSISNSMLPPNNIQIFWKRRDGKDHRVEGNALDELCSKIEQQWAKKKNYQPNNLSIKQILNSNQIVPGADRAFEANTAQASSEHLREPSAVCARLTWENLTKLESIDALDALPDEDKRVAALALLRHCEMLFWNRDEKMLMLLGNHLLEYFANGLYRADEVAEGVTILRKQKRTKEEFDREIQFLGNLIQSDPKLRRALDRTLVFRKFPDQRPKESDPPDFDFSKLESSDED